MLRGPGTLRVKLRAEMRLTVLADTMKRVIPILGVPAMIAAVLALEPVRWMPKWRLHTCWPALCALL